MKNTSTEFLHDRINEQIIFFAEFMAKIAEKEKLCNDDWLFIAESGTFNRVFRRWYQTVCLDESWTNDFAGVTPKQLVEKVVTDTFSSTKKSIYVSVFLDEDVLHKKSKVFLRGYLLDFLIDNEKRKCKDSPLIDSFEEIEKLFNNGASISEKGILNKVYIPHWYKYINQDRDFLSWVSHLLWEQKLLQFKPTLKSKRGMGSLNSQGKAYFSLDGADQLPLFIKAIILEVKDKFVNIVCNKMKDENTLKVSENKKEKICNEFSQLLYKVIKCGKWIDFDVFIEDVWKIVATNFPDKVWNLDKILCLEEERDSEKIEDFLKTLFTDELFKDVIDVINKDFLFPFNCYLGIIECVWTSSKGFIMDMMRYFSIAKQLSHKHYYHSEERKLFEEFCDLGFIPCTSFKFMDCLFS
ncbi:MAG: hypothetical protein PHQ52_01845 [Candidatus Omnitrophica bacterium]|nr:hypothetical protein [Candidatus Omnitrophota bacterium]